MPLTNRELGYLHLMRARCDILRARVESGKRNYVFEWAQELKALEWAIEKIEKIAKIEECSS